MINHIHQPVSGEPGPAQHEIVGGEEPRSSPGVGGLPAEILTEFSRRRHDITAAAEQVIADHETEHGPLSEGARTAMLAELLRGPRAQHLVLATRERKHFGDEHTWRDEILARAGEHGYDQTTRQRAVENGRRRLERSDVGAEDASAMRELGDELAGAAGLTQNTNAFETRDALREYAAAAAQGARVDTVRDQAAVFVTRGDVLQTAEGQATLTFWAALPTPRPQLAPTRGLAASRRRCAG